MKIRTKLLLILLVAIAVFIGNITLILRATTTIRQLQNASPETVFTLAAWHNFTGNTSRLFITRSLLPFYERQWEPSYNLLKDSIQGLYNSETLRTIPEVSEELERLNQVWIYINERLQNVDAFFEDPENTDFLDATVLGSVEYIQAV